MQRKTLQELERVAVVTPNPPRRQHLSKHGRLEGWAAALERRDLPLRSFVATEHADRAQREAMRVDDSPLTVAFDDPDLRAAGLTSDRLGEAMRFFGLTRREAHEILCYCHHGRAMSPRTAARCVRAAAARKQEARTQRLRAGAFCAVGLALAAAVL